MPFTLRFSDFVSSKCIFAEGDEIPELCARVDAGICVFVCVYSRVCMRVCVSSSSHLGSGLIAIYETL